MYGMHDMAGGFFGEAKKAAAKKDSGKKKDAAKPAPKAALKHKIHGMAGKSPVHLHAPAKPAAAPAAAAHHAAGVIHSDTSMAEACGSL
eukprot:gene26536-26008_t